MERLNPKVLSIVYTIAEYVTVWVSLITTNIWAELGIEKWRFLVFKVYGVYEWYFIFSHKGIIEDYPYLPLWIDCDRINWKSSYHNWRGMDWRPRLITAEKIRLRVVLGGTQNFRYYQSNGKLNRTDECIKN